MVRTYFSLLRGCLSPEDAAAMAAARGLRSAVILDRLNFYGLIRFANACRREGIRPIPGMDLSPEPRVPLAVLAAGRRGFSALNRLVTFIDRRDAGECPRRDPGLLDNLECLLDLIAEGAHPAQELDELYFVLPGDAGAASVGTASACAASAGAAPGEMRASAYSAPAIRRLMQRMEQLAGTGYAAGHVFVGIYDGVPARRARALAGELGIEALAAVWGSWRTETERRRIDLLRAIDLCVTVRQLPAADKTPEEQRISGDGEAAKHFAVFHRERRRSAELAASLDGSFLISGGYVFPAFRGLGDDQAFEELQRLCAAGAIRRYGTLRPDVRRRLAYELDIIRAKGFASYFLVVNDIVSHTPRTCGRGSSAASIVSYCLGITHVDPLKYNLFFERFLNMGRSDPPDIDVDFPWDERADTLRYVFETYPGRAAMVADHVTFGPRSSIREPAKAMGIDEEEISRFIRLWKLGQGQRLPEWLRREAVAIRGIPRFLGTHPGGVVITPGPLSEWTHSQISPLGWPVIAWEKDATEDAGLVKIDILGNRSLGVLRDCIAMINAHRGRSLSWENLNPLEDPETRRFIESGDTLGIFYVESPATRQLLQKMRTGDYPHLVIASSIIRPAANRYINEFVRRLHGGSWQPVDPRAEEVLAETRGIMVYQEDVSRVAIAVSGFDPAEADQLRKVLSRKDRDLKLDSWRKRFIDGGLARGGRAQALEELWDMIRSFEGYSFCKPHSASYALVSYKLAWIKRHYPLEFYTAVINNGGGYYSRQTYVNAARRLGHRVLLPDVNRGRIEYSIEYDEPGVPLRAGLAQISGLAGSTMERILAQRERGGPFTSFTDFFHRIRPNILQIRALIRSGALDSCDPFISRPAMFWILGSLRRSAATVMDRPAAREDAGVRPPATSGDLFDMSPAPPDIGDYSAVQKLRDEAEILGLFLSVHPISIFRERSRRLVRQEGFSPHIDSRQVADWLDRKVYITGLMVSGKEVYTRTRQAMSFISFEDEYGLYETVFFPDAYQQLIEVLDSSMVFLVYGIVRQELGAYSIHCINLFPLSRRYSKSTYLSDSFYTIGSMGDKGDRKAG
jgi:error-prone DNA polymerase